VCKPGKIKGGNIVTIHVKQTKAVHAGLVIAALAFFAAGNATIYMGSEVFQSYADELHSHPLIVLVFSLTVLFLFLTHIGLGLYLFFENRIVGPVRYAVEKRVADHSFACKTMPYTGLILLLFVLIHVFSFTFGPEDVLISETVKTMFQPPSESGSGKAQSVVSTTSTQFAAAARVSAPSKSRDSASIQWQSSSTMTMGSRLVR
jgi:succinate dehydrogenase/fumarate reductase cytochrome b subunit (b558 family)